MDYKPGEKVLFKNKEAVVAFIAPRDHNGKKWYAIKRLHRLKYEVHELVTADELYPVDQISLFDYFHI